MWAPCWDEERARAGAGREPKEAISKGKALPSVDIPSHTAAAPGMASDVHRPPWEREFKTEACEAWHKYEVWKTHSSRTVLHQIPRIPPRRRYQEHHSTRPIGERLRKRLKNVTNQESYFCEKEEKCHQKGSADNPIGLKIAAWLAEQSGNRQRARDVMQSAEGAPAEWSCWGMRKLA